MGFDDKLRQRLMPRLAGNINTIRQAAADLHATDNILSPQRQKLDEANRGIMAAVDDILEVLTIWGIADSQNMESSAALSDGIYALADTATLMQNEGILTPERDKIVAIMQNTAKGTIELVKADLDEETLKRWGFDGDD